MSPRHADLEGWAPEQGQPGRLLHPAHPGWWRDPETGKWHSQADEVWGIADEVWGNGQAPPGVPPSEDAAAARPVAEVELPLSEPAPAFLKSAESERVEWSISDILTREAVAFFAGEPKTLKTWAVIDTALAIATGAEAFGRFEPRIRGPVLIVQEESRRSDFARRIRWLARGHGFEPDRLLDLHIASQPGLLLDEEAGQRRLVADIERLGAVHVVLDPLVRMHSADEDRAREMRPVLRFIRRLQAEHACSVAVVHHLGKARNEGPKQRPGQRLRGTSDLHALLDTGLYFETRAGVRQVAVQVEHREAPPPEPFTLRLDVDAEAGEARLRAEDGTLADLAVLEALPDVEAALTASTGLTQRQVEEAVSRRREVVREALKRLEALGRAISAPERRPDALGRERQVQVWKRR